MTDFVLVSTTASSADEAQQIATTLVELRLAACVQIIPQVRSVYRWEERVEQADECLCLIKTRRALLPKVEATVSEQHSYDCPELIALPIEAGSQSYLGWLDEQLG